MKDQIVTDPNAMDVLTDVLERTRARGTLFARTVMHAPWGIRFSPHPNVQFHAVLRGSCWLRSPSSSKALQLLQGDFVLLTTPTHYDLVDEREATCETFESFLTRLKVMTHPQTIESPGDGAETVLLCGAYDFDDIPNPLLTGLPTILHVPASNGYRAPSMHSALAILFDELEQREPGSQAVIDRLVDMLLIYSLRFWLDREDTQQTNWLQALRSPDINKTLAAIHQQPEEPWTVALLAQRVSLSRATFARRFTDVVGQPPMSYLNQWRMTIAAELLRTTDLSVSSIAECVGYNNPYAFSTAFKRLRGEAPGYYRARSKEAVNLDLGEAESDNS